MPNELPYEIIAAPFEAWIAPVGEAFPAITAAPGVNWTLIGTSGDRNYTEEGVTVSHPQTVEFWRGLGDTMPRKAFRTQEELRVAFELADLSPEQYSLALKNTDAVVAVVGTQSLDLVRGPDVLQRALLLRGPSPLVATGNAQFEIAQAVQVGEPEVVFTKGAPAALALEFVALGTSVTLRVAAP
jgi:hypothetical protein